MPEIKIKHVVSFSSEDKVHKAENIIKPETYRKWKCAAPGEKNATIVVQFEKATQIHSIDIGNEGSAFVEVLVGRSSDSVNDYQALLVASSFMSPLESRNGTHTNRVRMFGPEKLSQSTKDEKWDCVQIVCTQPFNKTMSYGLSFIKFHSPPEKFDESSGNSESGKATSTLGAFKLKDDDDDSLPSVGSWFGKQRTQVSESQSSSEEKTPSYAAAVLASSSNMSKMSPQNTTQKRKIDDQSNVSQEPLPKKKLTVLNKEHIIYKDVLRDTPENKKVTDTNESINKNTSSPKPTIREKGLVTPSPKNKKVTDTNGNINKDTSSPKPAIRGKGPVTPSLKTSSATNVPGGLFKKKVPFDKIMNKVVFVLSGFVNPLRSELRDKAVEMGAKYKPDWDNTCTHLVCAFLNTPKYEQVKKLNGRIVSKDWILHSYRSKAKIPWKVYMLGKLSNDDSSESDYKPDESESSEEEIIEVPEDSDDEYTDKKKRKKKKPQAAIQRKKGNSPNSKALPSTPTTSKNSGSSNSRNNTPSSKDSSGTPKKKAEPGIFSKLKQLNNPSQENISDNSHSPTLLASKNESETEDEDALQDYIADTDVDDSSAGDTEDEIRKVEMMIQQKKKRQKTNGLKEDEDLASKPDVSNLPLPELPNLFKQKRFFLYGEFSSTKMHDMQRYIIAYNGVIEDYMSDKVKYVVTDKKWDKNFEDAVGANEDLIFVKPTWIYKCHDAKKLVPYQPFIIIPDS